jgi:heme exporter protein B
MVADPAGSTRGTARADGLLPPGAGPIARKDLRAELRTKEAINASLAFALVILLLFSFAFDPLEAGDHARNLRRPAVDRVRLRRHAGPEPQLRARIAQRLPGCPDRRAHLRRRAVPGQSLANFVLVMAVELVSLARLRYLL